MKDVQSSLDTRNIYINKVGIDKFKYPVLFKSGEKEDKVVADFEVSVSLSDTARGTHMSRFVEVIKNSVAISSESVKTLLSKVRSKLSSDNAYMKAEFVYFIKTLSPVSNEEALLDIDIVVDAKCVGDNLYKYITFIIPVTTLCPCSKEISDFGAHNQRADIKVKIEYTNDSHDDFIREISKRASSNVYPLLKRIDEKHVTENAYKNPRFVEDVVRDVAIFLKEKNIRYEFIEVKSYESIHNHIAFARIES